MALPSSSLVIKNEILPTCSNFFSLARNSDTEDTKAAIPDFISAAPLPQIFPSLISPPNGLMDHFSISPVGTTST